MIPVCPTGGILCSMKPETNPLKPGVWRWLLLWLAGGLLVACSGAPTPAEPPTPTPTPDPEVLARQIMDATEAAESLAFRIDFAGEPVYADPDGLFQMLDMQGGLQRPDAARATIRVRSVGSIAEIRLVSLEGQQYATNPITRDWLCFPPGALFDPVLLFDTEQGVSPLLREEFTTITLEGSEEQDGELHYHLRGTIDAAPLRQMSMGMLGAGPVAVDLWASQETLRASRIVLTDTATNPDNPSQWHVALAEYNEPVEVVAPTECP